MQEIKLRDEYIKLGQALKAAGVVDSGVTAKLVILDEKVKSGKIIIKDIEVNGTENLLKLLQNDIKIVTIFLKVPKEESKNRLEHRTEHVNEHDIEVRLNRFDYEESKIGMYDYVIKNDNLEKSVQIILTIIQNEYKLKNKN